ncbi:hypothetical protein HMPREF0262_02475 [Clostridium sp. ATCC 29733]|nr:hypothetical protein HMPREF0262_02475 [Clostridium sp. ATCC 29733]
MKKEKRGGIPNQNGFVKRGTQCYTGDSILTPTPGATTVRKGGIPL